MSYPVDAVDPGLETHPVVAAADADAGAGAGAGAWVICMDTGCLVYYRSWYELVERRSAVASAVGSKGGGCWYRLGEPRGRWQIAAARRYGVG